MKWWTGSELVGLLLFFCFVSLPPHPTFLFRMYRSIHSRWDPSWSLQDDRTLLHCGIDMEFVYRSTDSQLKLWNVNRPHCLRSFKGHINEKNFVGLASNGDYIACGEWLTLVPSVEVWVGITCISSQWERLFCMSEPSTPVLRRKQHWCKQSGSCSM